MDNQVQEIIESVLQDFRQPDSLDRIASHVIPRDDRPCGKWSLLNRYIAVRRSEDSRGFRQWEALGRQVKKGAKALFILAPLLVWAKKKDKNGVEKNEKVLVGFKRVPVFKIEDTDGKPVAYPDFTPKQMPPLLNVAKTWGLDVQYGPDFFDRHMLGFYRPGEGEIRLMSHDVKVFFHELAHAGHERLQKQKLNSGQDPKQEIVAEFSAAILLRLYGFKGEGNAYDYIARYAVTTGKNDVPRACMSVLSVVEKIVKSILEVETGEDQQEEPDVQAV